MPVDVEYSLAVYQEPRFLLRRRLAQVPARNTFVEHTVYEVIRPVGRRVLRSTRFGTRLFLEQRAGMFSALDVLGDRRSGLHVLALAVARLSLERDRDEAPPGYRITSDNVCYTKVLRPRGGGG